MGTGTSVPADGQLPVPHAAAPVRTGGQRTKEAATSKRAASSPRVAECAELVDNDNRPVQMHPAVFAIGKAVDDSSDKVAATNNTRNGSGSHPIHEDEDATESTLLMAAELGSMSLIKRCLSGTKLNVYTKNEDGDSLTMYAAGIGHLEMMDYLLSKAPDLAWEENKMGLGPMHTAAMQGYLHVVKHLVEQAGVPVDYTQCNVVTPLEAAAKVQQREVCEYLMQQGARPTLVADQQLRQQLRMLKDTSQ